VGRDLEPLRGRKALFSSKGQAVRIQEPKKKGKKKRETGTSGKKKSHKKKREMRKRVHPRPTEGRILPLGKVGSQGKAAKEN